MARTITNTTQAWISASTNPKRLHDINAVDSMTFYTPLSEKAWRDAGYTFVGSATITVEIADESAIYAAKVDSLKAAKTQVLADAQAKATAIESEIQKLLAITFDGVEA